MLTIHDLAPWRFPDEGTPPRHAALEACRADVVLCPSQFSADEVCTILKVRSAVVIPNGARDAFFNAKPLSEGELASLGVRVPYVLHVGGSTLRKNLVGLAAAWPLVRQVFPDISLVMVGPPDLRRDRVVSPLSAVTQLGYLPVSVLAGLMAAARLLVVPSTYEGFGLPAIEAMAAGTPVVAANRGALPEVCGDGAVLVEATGRGIADGMTSVLEGGPHVTAMLAGGGIRARAYTWEASVAAHASIWRAYGIPGLRHSL